MISTVILAYNRRAEVLVTISKMKEYSATLPFPMEIIVVDNASTDNTSTEISEKHPDVTLITKKENNGVAGWNKGFEVAKGDYFLVLDDDSHVHSGLLEAIQYMEQDKELGILALNILDKELKEHTIPAEDAWKDKEYIEGFIGCGAIIRREVYEKIGGFSEWLFIYTHEFDYAIRCMNAGYRIKFFEKGLVVHRASVINRTNKRLKVYGTRNEMAIVYKFFPKSRWKYLMRVWVNNFKNIKKEGLASAYYTLLGGIEFLKFKNNLSYTPVSTEVQNFYASHFGSTRPIFYKLKKRLFS